MTYELNSYPIEKKQILDVNLESKDEMRYPNGTVIGKYSYKDKEGNPVHVKYYADDSSYGVELKSFKILGANIPTIPQDQPNLDYSVNTEFPFNISSDPVLENNFKIDKDTDFNVKKTKPDRKLEYEIYRENELKPEKYNNGRVRVYYDKNNKRKIRNVFDPYGTFRFCEQF
ncbi:uncharacterized protein LOC123692367 [Colias croceus]|uniref:uncharacterized protein LOC123692367 n=1 Tax=Colias crocea TaxID=72248 RepID=UPI001E279F16|nr:uncharacterized protein LOC123692367 [Colias croceus]